MGSRKASLSIPLTAPPPPSAPRAPPPPPPPTHTEYFITDRELLAVPRRYFHCGIFCYIVM